LPDKKPCRSENQRNDQTPFTRADQQFRAPRHHSIIVLTHRIRGTVGGRFDDGKKNSAERAHSRPGESQCRVGTGWESEGARPCYWSAPRPQLARLDKQGSFPIRPGEVIRRVSGPKTEKGGRSNSWLKMLDFGSRSASGSRWPGIASTQNTRETAKVAPAARNHPRSSQKVGEPTSPRHGSIRGPAFDAGPAPRK